MMDGSRKVSLRNKQFVRKIEVPMPISSPGVRASQFNSSRHDDVADMQDLQGENTGVDEHGIRGQVPEIIIGLTQLKMTEAW